MYNYWFVGYIGNLKFYEKHPSGRMGRIEITYPDNTHGYSDEEYFISYDWSLLEGNVEFEDFIDGVETEEIKSLDELFGMYYDLTGIELELLT